MSDNGDSSVQAFYNIPADIWDQIVLLLDRQSLAVAALISRNLHPHANRLLYKKLEISFCKCSQTYLDALAWTITKCADLAALAKELLVDMSVQCKVESIVTHSAGPWMRFTGSYPDLSPRIRSPLVTRDQWNREAVRLLQQYLEQIMPNLHNLMSIKIILGRFDGDPKYARFLSFSPKATLEALQNITLRDISISLTPSIEYLTSLRSLDLAYVACGAEDLWKILAANANTLEDLSLRYVINYSPVPLFGGTAPDVTLHRLRYFNLKGLQLIDATGLSSLLGGCPELKRIWVEILSFQLASAWSEVLLNLANPIFPVRQLESIVFNAPMASAAFWDSLCVFLLRSGQNIQSLYISANAAERVSAPFPPSLHKCLFLNMQKQSILDRLVIIWPDGIGLDLHSLRDLSLTFPHITLLHVYLPYPEVAALLSLITSFENLHDVHFIFAVDRNGLLQNSAFDDIQMQEAVTRAMRNNLARTTDTLIKSFASEANIKHFSWSLYEHNRGRSPILFAEITETKNIRYIDREVVKFGEHYKGSIEHKCMVGTKQIKTSRKPGWRDRMGNPFLDGKRICPHAEFI